MKINRINNSVLPLVIAAGMLGGCSKSDTDELVPGSGGNIPGGEPVAFSISLGDTPEYNVQGGETRGVRSGAPLLSEWAKVNTFDATRAAEEPGSPGLVLMELYEDTVSATSAAAGTPVTRSTTPMPVGTYFRVIAFKKSGAGPNDYVFQSAADYTANGSSAPVLQQGDMFLPLGQTYRFAAYSFNNTTALGALPTAANCKWNDGTTAISIPNLSNDFLSFVSGDMDASGLTLNLPVIFSHRLARLTVKVSGQQFTGCTGVYVKEGGSSSSWAVGAADIAPNTSDTPAFTIADNSSAWTRVVPFAGARAVTVHIGAITVKGFHMRNLDVTSSGIVQVAAGKSYTMNVRFKPDGINVPEADINLGGEACKLEDIQCLAKLIWATGNLRQQNDNGSGPTIMAGPSDPGHYYTWNSEYTGSTSSNGKDPCKSLDVATYGSGWRTPLYSELGALSRCTDNVLTNGGMWYMNSTSGLYLPAAGTRGIEEGSGTARPANFGMAGSYWGSNSDASGRGINMFFIANNQGVAFTSVQRGLSVRCVKEM